MSKSICSSTRVCSAVLSCCRAVKQCFLFILCFPVKCLSSPCMSCQTSVGRRLCVLYAITFILILPNLFRTVPHSTYYSQMNKTVLKELMMDANSARIVLAEKYFSVLNNSDVRSRQTSHGGLAADNRSVTVALTIVTVSRNRHKIDKYEPKYLTQTVWKFHSLLENWQRRNPDVRIHMSICNVDSDARSYWEANALSRFVPMFSRFNETYFPLVHTLEKEKQDYVYCLNQSLAVHKEASYVFLVEDDALPTDDVYDVLQRVLFMHTERVYSRGEFHPKPSNIAYVKFYHPERLLNFISFESERLPELFSYAVFLSLMLMLVHVIMCGCVTDVSVNVLWGRLFLFSVIVMLACGRIGVSQWRRLASPNLYSFTVAPSCCTPAMLFPRAAADFTVRYLNSSTCTNHVGKDSLLDQMLKETHMSAYLVQPSTFTHIGVYSSLRLRIVDPFMV